MLSIKKKSGNKSTDHYFHHVDENDGSRKYVYLGTDLNRAKEKITKIRLERFGSKKRIVRKLEKAQAKLNKIAEHNKPYDQLVKEIRQKYYRERAVNNIIKRRDKSSFSVFNHAIVPLASIAVAVMLFFFFNSSPSITGATTRGIAEIASSSIVSNAFSLAFIVFLFSLFLYVADYRHRHRHDKYKPPE